MSVIKRNQQETNIPTGNELSRRHLSDFAQVGIDYLLEHSNE